MLSYNDTKLLIEAVLNESMANARTVVHKDLQEMTSNEGEFYESIAEHAPSMKLTSDQWFNLLSKLPNQVFWLQISINKILSEEQIKRLPPVTG